MALLSVASFAVSAGVDNFPYSVFSGKEHFMSAADKPI
ncbi:hypothetical protein A343_0911 [Porphyromonas gingivalis JCVI SC001]|nr:hypothetical protein A343_0911 [Porphyromonas gingivalis JCVI SC001]